MPDYGVGAPGWEALPWSWAAERLVGYRNYWVVTVSPDGRPHALPVWGVWSGDDDAFAFSCAPGSRKRKNLAANPKVTIAGDDTVECISLQGTARPVADEAQQERWIERYLAKYQALSPELSQSTTSRRAESLRLASTASSMSRTTTSACDAAAASNVSGRVAATSSHERASSGAISRVVTGASGAKGAFIVLSVL